MKSLKTDNWLVVYLGLAVVIKRRKSGKVKILARSKLPDWRDLYVMSRNKFDLVCMTRFHGRA